MISYNNKEIIYEGCPGCAYSKHEFDLDCGVAYENERFILSQDWELPIQGLFIVSPKRHVEKLSELTNEERNEMLNIVDKTVRVLRDNNICDAFDYILEEKENKHLHLIILPRYNWMKKISDDIISNIKTIFDYAKTNYKNESVYEEIKRINDMIKTNFN